MNIEDVEKLKKAVAHEINAIIQIRIESGSNIASMVRSCANSMEKETEMLQIRIQPHVNNLLKYNSIIEDELVKQEIEEMIG